MQGLVALGCMEHRGGCSADNDSGDGAGIMTRIPWELLGAWQKERGGAELDPASTGVGMVFLPKEAASDAKKGRAQNPNAFPNVTTGGC